jgi:hypothetical protein
VPEKRPEGVAREAYLTAAQFKALGRVYEDAKQFLWLGDEDGSACQ